MKVMQAGCRPVEKVLITSKPLALRASSKLREVVTMSEMSFHSSDVNCRTIEFLFCYANIRKIINNSKDFSYFVRKNAGFLMVTNSSEKSTSHQTTCSMPLGAVITLR